MDWLRQSFPSKIFQALEHPLEVDSLTGMRDLVLLERQNFVHFIFNGSWNSVIHRDRIDQVNHTYCTCALHSG